MSVATQLAALTYIAMAVCILLAEFLPWRKPAVAAAYAAIFFVSMGSTAWCYAAFYSPADWFDMDHGHKPDSGKSGPQKQLARSGGGDGEDEGDDEAGGGKSNRRGSNEGAGSVSEGLDTAIDLIERKSYGLARKTAHALGLGRDGDGPAQDSGIVKDCSDCPELITIRPGTALIGADETDGDARAAEKPAHERKFWPGFRIGREAVSRTSYARFLAETGREQSACSVDAPSNTAEGSMARFAHCVTPADAGAYVAWLSGITGKRYRLPTAAEWEFAVKTSVTAVAALGESNPANTLQVGDVREIAADCWYPYLPSLGRELLAANAGPHMCESRMSKGWFADDERVWKRLSARREIEKNAAPFATGLRVVRDLN